MRSARRQVQMLMAVMMMLNGILLMLARGEVWPLILLLLLPLPLWYIVDVKKWYELPSWAANTIGLGIGAYAMYFFWFQATERHLAIVSDMVCYLLLTMLLQTKSPRLYWQMTILSVLQSVVASVFSLDLQQGVVFISYTFVVLLALSAIVLYRDQLVVALKMDQNNNDLDEHRVRKREVVRPLMTFRPGAGDGQVSGFRSAFFAIGLLAFFSVVAGMSIYVTIPRLEDSLDADSIQLKTTGVTRQIESLEPSGVLQPNNSEALRLRVIDPSTGKSMRLNGDVYLRGATLEVLKSESTGWLPYRSRVPSSALTSLPTFAGKVYRQEIVMVPRAEPMLFYALPLAPALNVSRDILFDMESEMMLRFSATGSVSSTPFRYELGVYGVERQSLPNVSPFLNFNAKNYDKPLNEDYDSRYGHLTRFDPERYPTLLAKAREIRDRLGSDRSRRQVVCEAIADYLANSGDFSYTTDFRSIVRDQSLDPVEDFVANYRSGHCELYASALCLMLRSLEIPARVVVGYRTARYNEVAGHYLVQEKHAHSWVEAYLRPLDCSEEMKSQQVARAGGAWLRLDATPAADQLDDDLNLFGTAGDALGLAQSLWDEYIMGIQESQTGAEKSSKLGSSVLQALMDPTALVESIRGRFLQMSVGARLLLGCAILVFWIFVLRQAARRRRRAGRAGPSVGRSGWWDWLGLGANTPGTEFEGHWADAILLELERLAVKYGFSGRQQSMTPLEFARHWSEEVRGVLAGPELAVAGSAVKLPGVAAAASRIDQEPVGSGDGVGLADKIESEIAALVARYYELKYAGGGRSEEADVAGGQALNGRRRSGGARGEGAALLAEGRAQLQRIESYLPPRTRVARSSGKR